MSAGATGIRTRPFLALALFTLIIGAVWHLSGLSQHDGPVGFALYALSYVLGTPFILAMRLVGSVVTQPVIRGILGFVLGMLPYIAADEGLRRRRLRRQRAQPEQGPLASRTKSLNTDDTDFTERA